MLNNENGKGPSQSKPPSMRAPASGSGAQERLSGALALQFLEAVPVCAMYADRDGFIRYVNKATRETFRSDPSATAG